MPGCSIRTRTGSVREPLEHLAGEQPAVAGPTRGHVVPVLHDEGGSVVRLGAAAQARLRTDLELVWGPQCCGHLLLNVGRVGAVVAAELPCGHDVRRAL